MKDRRSWVDRLRAMARGTLRIAAGTLGAVAIAVLWSFAASSPERTDLVVPVAQAPAGWGAEALADVRDAMRAVSPIAEANACGMGTSSCFKCHNGTRAKAPPNEAWHNDHRSVDNSCIGCHKGNARLIKKELAHADLVGNSRTKAEELCAGCHKSGNLADLTKAYAKK